MAELKLNKIVLKSGLEVIIDYNSKKKCLNCDREVFVAVKTALAREGEERRILVELVSLAQWDIHECKVYKVKGYRFSDEDMQYINAKKLKKKNKKKYPRTGRNSPKVINTVLDEF